MSTAAPAAPATGNEQRPPPRPGAIAGRWSAPRTLLGLGVALMVVAIIAAGRGAVPIAPGDVLRTLLHGIGFGSDTDVPDSAQRVLWHLRFPRVALAIVAGAALAVSGAALQGLFRNPLADPTLIGVSFGAAAGAATMIVLGHHIALPAWFSRTWLLPAGAFTGGLLATGLAYLLSAVSRDRGVAALLLAGIAVNAAASALLGLYSHIADDAQLRNISFWNLGSLGAASPSTLGVVALIALPATLGLLKIAPQLNALALGEAAAQHLGVNVRRLKTISVILIAACVGAVTAVTGVIVFVGLVVPHALRFVLGPDHRWLMPAAAVGGAALVTLADLTARTLLAPAELPIGIVTAFIGVPFFAALLIHSGRRLGP
ncbi:MAG: iron ABC transporter permease [Burkholderiales bacterium]|nr:iron ABC transporter permease [Burkholderiales bacterium]